MVTIDRINSDYTIYYDSQAGLFRGLCNKCGGEDASASANKETVQQAVVDLLVTAGGGSMFLKDNTLHAGVLSTLPSNVLVIEDRQGLRTFYRDAKKLFELEDLADLVVEL